MCYRSVYVGLAILCLAVTVTAQQIPIKKQTKKEGDTLSETGCSLAKHVIAFNIANPH